MKCVGNFKKRRIKYYVIHSPVKNLHYLNYIIHYEPITIVSIIIEENCLQYKYKNY